MLKKVLLLITLFLILFSVRILNADTIPGGDVSGTWYQANSPYYITGDITIPVGDTLTIEPDVDVIFLGLYRLTVRGRLFADGTVSDSIRFMPQDTVIGWRGLYYYGTGTCTQGLSFCIIEHARESGIHMQAVALNLNISDCTITNCHALLGGGIRINGIGSTLNITRSNICYNTAEADTGGRGGGIYAEFGTLKMDSCIVHANRAVIPTPEENYSVHGGGIYLNYATVYDTITNSSFTDNFIGLSNGGQSTGEPPFSADGGVAMYNDSEEEVVISDCVFSGNTGNARFGEGGGIFASMMARRTLISHCLFHDNRLLSTNCLGSALHIMDGADITNCTFFANGGRTIFFENCHIRYYNLINNIFAYDAGAVEFWPPISDSTLNVAYNDFMDTWSNMPPGFGVPDTVNYNGDSCDVYFNIFMDPMFVDTVNGDLHLLSNSPCIDAGDPASPYDPDSTIADMGCYFFDQTGIEEISTRVSNDYCCLSCLPNPCKSSAKIQFSLPVPSLVNLSVYDISGRLVSSLASGQYEPGIHEASLDASDFSAGVYFYRLEANEFAATEKVIITK